MSGLKVWIPCSVFATIGAVIAIAAATARADDWPQFRGPTGFGLSPAKGLPVTWGGPQKANVLWTSPTAGEGHASPIVRGDRLFTCSVKWPEDPAARKAAIPEHHVTCYATADGKQLWDAKLEPGPWLRGVFRSGPGGGYAAPTPCTDGKHVFVAFGSAVLASFDFDGHLAWRKELVPYTFDVTLGSSPVLYKDTVILLCAMAKKADSRVVAFDAATGAARWEAKMPTVGFAHSTPVLIDVKGKAQLLILASGIAVAPDGLQALDPATGERIWWCRAGGDAASPAYGDGIVYVDSGRGGPGFAVDPTGTGDVTKTHVKWTVPQVPEAIGSAIISGGLVYRLHSPGVVKCWKAATGEEVYSRRLEGLSSTWASPILDGEGHLLFASGGRSVVVKAGPEPEILGVNDLGDANHASAAVAGGRIYIVGLKQVYCVGRVGAAAD
jgi:outer membrane protein assembly factor BamB